MEYYVNIDL
jgi:hypothetical protein